MIKENEKKYGKELREKYGDDSINHSNVMVQSFSNETWNEVKSLSDKILCYLKKAYDQNDTTCDDALKAVQLHKKWLSYFYDYSKEYHLGLADLYVEDERFSKNYDVIGKDGAKFFRDAIYFHVSKNI